MKLIFRRPKGRHRYSTPEDQIEILKLEIDFLRRVAADRKALIRKLGQDLKDALDREEVARRQIEHQDQQMAVLEEASFFNGEDSPTLEIELRRPVAVPELVVPEAGSASGLPASMVGRGHLRLVRMPS